MHGVAVFAGVALVVTLTPGPATATVIRSALRGGRRSALATTVGNSLGVLFWGVASALGVAALVAASEAAFLALKVGGAVVLVWLGVQSFRHGRGRAPAVAAVEMWSPHAFRDGLVTSLANPKLAVFFVSLFPQFIERGHSSLAVGVSMAATIVALDLVWYSTLALIVTRLHRAFAGGAWQRRLERLTGCMMVGLGLRLALESR